MTTRYQVPDLGPFVFLDLAWSDIRSEHRELTGKQFTSQQARNLLAEVDKRSRAGHPISLKALWEEKYHIPTRRQKHQAWKKPDDDLSKILANFPAVVPVEIDRDVYHWLQRYGPRYSKRINHILRDEMRQAKRRMN